MNPTRTMRLWTAAAIIIFFLVIGFILSAPSARDGVLPPSSSPPVATSTPVVTLRDSFKKGTHTISGSLEAPDACMSATAEASLTGASSSPVIAVAIDMPPDSGICLQEPTPVTFSAALAAPADVPIEVTVNGVAATTSTSSAQTITP